MSKLTTLEEQSLIPFEPQVLSKANPTFDWLLQARADFNRDPKLRQLFLDHCKGDAPSEVAASLMGSHLATQWGGYENEAYEAVLYLIDEYRQLGEGIHLVSKETGRITVTLTEEDLWQPPDVLRENGEKATPLKRIRPDLEAFITTLTFERAREKRIAAELARRGHQTTLLKEDGDPRLLIATRAGRRQIVQGLAESDPKALFETSGGTSGAFLRFFAIHTTAPTESSLEALPHDSVIARCTHYVGDLKTSNLHYHHKVGIQGAIAQGWVRQIATQLSHEAQRRFKETQKVTLESKHLEECSFWVAPPELVAKLKALKPDCTVLPAEQAALIGFSKPTIGALVLPTEFCMENAERFDTWAVTAYLSYQLWVDWHAIKYVCVEG